MITTFVALTVGFSSTGRARDIPFIPIVVAEAVIAIGCLAYLMYGDPGVVRRSRAPIDDPMWQPDTSYEYVKEAGENLDAACHGGAPQLRWEIR